MSALAPAVAVAIMVRMFGRISMAHFNPAVTVAFYITKHMPKRHFPLYLGAEIIGALLGSVFVKYVIGTEANLGANAPDYHFSIPLIVGVEILSYCITCGCNLGGCSYKRATRIWGNGNERNSDRCNGGS